MQFITILEFNHKENEPVLHYCQWNGNELELEKLFAIVDNAIKDREFAYCGDISTFTYSRVSISEAAVDEHIRLPYGSYTRMYKKHVGTFLCPPFTTPVLNESRDAYVDGPMTEPRACSAKLDEYFYGARLGHYFKHE